MIILINNNTYLTSSYIQNSREFLTNSMFIDTISSLPLIEVKNIDTKLSNKRNIQNPKSKRQDYNMK